MASTLLSNNALPRLLCCLVGLVPVVAQAASDWKTSSGVSLSERYTDNVGLTPGGGQSSFISQVSPTFSMSRRGKRGSANLTYTLTDLLYDSGSNNLSHALNANMQVEPVEGVLKIVGNAQVSQQYASQFGATSLDTYSKSANRVEARSFTLTPSLHNELFDRNLITDASLGLNYASAGGGTLSSSTSNALNFSAKNGPHPNRWSYSANYGRNSGDSAGAATSTFTSESYNVGYAIYDRTRVFLGGGRNSATGVTNLQGQGSSYTTGGINWTPVNYLSLTATAGTSGGTTSYSLSGNWKPNVRLNLAATAGRRNNGTSYSLNGNWTPSALTSLSASAQKNFDSGTFGVDTATSGLSSYGYTAYTLNLNHRVRRAVVGLTYSESVLNASQQINQTVTFPYYLCDTDPGPGTHYQFQAVVPGQPMPANCSPVDVQVPYNQLRNQATYNKTWAGTLNLELGRSGFAFTLSQSQRQSLGGGATTTAIGASDQQTAFSANWTLPLSGRTTTSLGTNWSTAQAATDSSDTWALFWNLAHQISPHVTSSVNARHSEQRTNVATTGNVKENTVSAQLGMTF
jgi:hypothetical protein